MIPAAGIIPDLIIAGISAVRRDWGNAGLCLLAAIPIIGAAAGAAKIGAQAFKSLTKPAKKTPIITKSVETTSRIKNGISKVSTKAISAMEDSASTISNGIKGLVEDIKAGKFPSKPRALVDQSGSLLLRRGNRVTEGAGKSNPNNVKVSQGQQDKHIPGTNNYKQSVESGVNRSILNENPQQLLDGHAGTGTSMGANKEWVDFGKVIGKYYDASTGTYVDTTKGIIHYNSSGGAHIVPSNPTGMR